MIKDTAGQQIGAQLVDATTGGAFAGTVTVYVTGDAGTQNLGTVGSGACVNEGNGYYTYAPAQAETNYDLIAFTFVGTGAIPATIQVFTVTGPVSSTTPPAVPTGATTIADALDLLAVLDNELDVDSGGADEARALVVLKAAQRYFESIAALMPRVLQQTLTITTTASVETTTWTSTLRRLDALWALDPSTGLPTYRLKRINQTGGHVPSLPWPLQLSLSTGVGAPSGYYANSRNFYWLPLPDGTHSLRVYGFFTGAVLVDRTSLFAYPDECLLPFASFAGKLMAMGVADTDGDLTTLADVTFRPILKSMKKIDRSEPIPRSYTYAHDT